MATKDKTQKSRQQEAATKRGRDENIDPDWRTEDDDDDDTEDSEDDDEDEDGIPEDLEPLDALKRFIRACNRSAEHSEKCRETGATLQMEKQNLQESLLEWLKKEEKSCVPVTVLNDRQQQEQRYLRLRSQKSYRVINPTIVRRAVDMIERSDLEGSTFDPPPSSPATEDITGKQDSSGNKKPQTTASKKRQMEESQYILDRLVCRIMDAIRQQTMKEGEYIDVSSSKERGWRNELEPPKKKLTKKEKEAGVTLPPPPLYNLCPAKLTSAVQKFYSKKEQLERFRSKARKSRQKVKRQIESLEPYVQELLMSDNVTEQSMEINVNTGEKVETMFIRMVSRPKTKPVSHKAFEDLSQRAIQEFVPPPRILRSDRDWEKYKEFIAEELVRRLEEQKKANRQIVVKPCLFHSCKKATSAPKM